MRVLIGERHDGTLLVARSDSLHAFHQADRRSELLARGLPRVTSVFTDSRGRLWLGTADGLFEFKSGRELARIRSVAVRLLVLFFVLAQASAQNPLPMSDSYQIAKEALAGPQGRGYPDALIDRYLPPQLRKEIPAA